jgi:diguanylate cyclase (GGDEF)-like protein
MVHVNAHERGYGALSALFAITLVSLVATLVAGYQARLHIADRAAWVEHTSQVKLAIAEGDLHLARAAAEHPDPAALVRALEALRFAEQSVLALTVDNGPQQVRVTRALEMEDRLARASADGRGDTPEWRASAKSLERLHAEMAADEDRLMVIRARALELSRVRSTDAFAAGTSLTFILAVVAVAFLRKERAALSLAQHEIHRQRAMLDSVVDSVGEGVMAMTPTREFLVVNQACRDMLGDDFPLDRLPADWSNKLVATLENGKLLQPEAGALARAVRGETVNGLIYHVMTATSPAGGTWVSASGRPIRDERGVVVAGVVTLRNINEQRRHAEQLRDLSLRDELTHLYNRRGFLTLAEQHMLVVARNKHPFALLYADLDGLKEINDELGHEAGDRAIVDAATVLRDAFRDSDLVARLGGDEFVVLLADAGPSKGDILVRRFYDAIATLRRAGTTGHISVSIGITFYDPDFPLPLNELLAEADRLMYTSKLVRRSSRLALGTAPDVVM